MFDKHHKHLHHKTEQGNHKHYL